jgi:hypothetical protein
MSLRHRRKKYYFIESAMKRFSQGENRFMALSITPFAERSEAEEV